jgi:hypothetical protein
MISSVRTTALSTFEAPNFKAWIRYRHQDQLNNRIRLRMGKKVKRKYFYFLDEIESWCDVCGPVESYLVIAVRSTLLACFAYSCRLN